MSDIWTAEFGKCFICGRIENGYSLQDKNGEWQTACWKCCQDKLERRDEKKEI